MNRKIYVVNYKEQDLREAEKYGELVYLTEGVVNIFNMDSIMFRLSRGLRNMTPDDMILLSGSPILNAIACMIASKKHGHVDVLIYDKKGLKYFSDTIPEIKEECKDA